MHAKIKALVVVSAMLTTFAILPTFGAAAAEPLDDGSYVVTIGTTAHTLQVVDGVPVVDETEGVAWNFAFDDDGRVLDEFDVTVGQFVYEVEVAEDGTAYASIGGTTEPTEEQVALPVVTEESAEVEAEAEAEETAEDEEPEAAEDEAHGALVSTVAQCAPAGRTARDAGLPNHGTFVRAVAQGEVVEFEVDGESYTADLTTEEGAAAFCTLADELVAAAAEEAATEDTDETRGNGNGRGNSDADDRGRGNGRGNSDADDRGNGNGRTDAPGQNKKGD